MQRSSVLLAVFYISICSVVLFRVSVEATGYLDRDSWHYLELAENLLEGRGFYMSDQFPIPTQKTAENQIFFTYWPAGYPVLIAFTSAVTTLSPFAASKVVNLVFLGLTLLLFRKVSPRYSMVLGLSMCSFTMLEVFSYTWSEGPFLFFLLLFCFFFHRYRSDLRLSSLLLLSLAALMLFLMRYVGLFSFLLIGFAGFYDVVVRGDKKGWRLILMTSIPGSVALLYLFNNFLHAGEFWGGGEYVEGTLSMSQFFTSLLTAVVNEFFVVRHFYWQSPADPLFILTAVIQIGFYIFLYVRFLRGVSFRLDGFGRILLLSGFAYLAILILLRAQFQFDDFSYRLLAPFSFLVYTALLYMLESGLSEVKARSVMMYMSGFFIFSLILNLPKRFILDQITVWF